MQILFPSHILGNHWILIVVSILEKEVIILDPMIYTHRKNTLIREVKSFVQFMDKIMEETSIFSNRELCEKRWRVSFIDQKLGLPVQPDS